MPKFIDMTGWKMWEHGVSDSKITIIRRGEDYVNSSGQHIIRWVCQCNCGSDPFLAVGAKLRNGHTKSCGCLRKEVVAKMQKKTNQFDIESFDYGVGWTTNTNSEFYFDLDDFDKIKDYTWYEHINKYNGYHSLMTGKHTKMSELLGFKYYDHIDRNPLNNRKNNFRKCTITENTQNRTKMSNNTSEFIGVDWVKIKQKWRARIKINKKEINLGLFVDKNDAIQARLKAEAKYYGEFAPQRHLFEEYGISNGGE